MTDRLPNMQEPRALCEYWTPKAAIDEQGQNRYMQCINHPSQLPVFASDVDGSAGAVGAKTYFLCDHDYFVQEFYRSDHPDAGARRNIYEVIQPFRPTKLYMDIDWMIGTREQGGARQQAFVELLSVVQEYLCSAGADPHPPLLVLCGSTDSKFSKHIITPTIQFPTQAAVHDAVTAITQLAKARPKTSAIASHIDLSVYSKNRCFRILHSKKNKPGASPLVVDWTNTRGLQHKPTTKTEHEMILGDSLVQYCERAILHAQVYDAIKETSGYALSFGRHITSVGAIEGDHGRKIASFCKKRNIKIISIRERRGGAYSFILKGARCPELTKRTDGKQRIHRSNNAFGTYMIKTGTMTVTCADADCPRVPFIETAL